MFEFTTWTAFDKRIDPSRHVLVQGKRILWVYPRSTTRLDGLAKAHPRASVWTWAAGTGWTKAS